jgi:flagellar biosynthesis protein FlhF
VVVMVEESEREVFQESEKPQKEAAKATYAPPAPKREVVKYDKSPFDSITEVAREISDIVQSRDLTPHTKKVVETDKIAIPHEILANLPTIKEHKELKKEIDQLTDKIVQIQGAIWDERAVNRNYLDIPPEFSNIYKKAKMSGMNIDHLDSLMKLTLENMPIKMRASTKTIDRYFYLVLKKMIPVRFERKLPSESRKVMMFVGPTGVGKTTTIAKLAARYSLNKEYDYKVGIITLDDYRIGAEAQLRDYASTLGLPLQVVKDHADLERAIMALSHCNIILIDTAGSSQYDLKKIERTGAYLDRSDAIIDVNLVLAANTKYEDMLVTYNSFSSLSIDTLIFTKIDETSTLGNIFSIIYETKKPISYVSNGQEVPEDIVAADSEYLVREILEGSPKSRQGKK